MFLFHRFYCSMPKPLCDVRCVFFYSLLSVVILFGLIIETVSHDFMPKPRHVLSQLVSQIFSDSKRMSIRIHSCGILAVSFIQPVVVAGVGIQVC